MKKIFLLAVLFCSTLCSHLLAQSQDGEFRLNIMSYNVRNGRGMDQVTSYRRIGDIIKHVSPDVVALQEIDSITGRNKAFVLKEMAELSDMPYYTYGAAINYDGGRYGVGILSKEKPLNYKKIPLPGREEKRILLIVEFDKYFLLCTHMSLTPEDQVEAANIIRSIVENMKSKPVFLAGDLNSIPTGKPIVELSKSFTILSDINAPTHPSDGPKKCIDYIMVSPSGKNIKTNFNYVYNEPIASDHCPIVVGVCF